MRTCIAGMNFVDLDAERGRQKEGECEVLTMGFAIVLVFIRPRKNVWKQRTIYLVSSFSLSQLAFHIIKESLPFGEKECLERIESETNRFVRGQEKRELVCDGYDVKERVGETIEEVKRK
jgi:hypothetical protein